MDICHEEVAGASGEGISEISIELGPTGGVEPLCESSEISIEQGPTAGVEPLHESLFVCCTEAQEMETMLIF